MLLVLQCRRLAWLRSYYSCLRELMQQDFTRWCICYTGGYYGGGAYYPYYGGGYSGPGYEPCKSLALSCLHDSSGSYSCQRCMIAVCQ